MTIPQGQLTHIIRPLVSDLNSDPKAFLQRIKKLIEELEQYLLGEIEISLPKIRDIADEITGGYAVLPVSIPLSTQQSLCRAVKYEGGDGGHAYRSAARLSYIQSTHIEPKQNRLNSAGNAMFYCCLGQLDNSNCRGALLAECKAKEGEIFNILHSQTVPADTSVSQTLNLFTVGIIDYCRRGVELPFGLSSQYKEFHDLLRAELNQISMMGIYLRDAFLADLFKRKENIRLFNITSALAAVFMRHDLIDGVIFPSTKFEMYPNVALKPSSVDKKICYKNAVAIQVRESLGYGMYETVCIDAGDVVGGNIQWMNHGRASGVNDGY